MTEDSRLQYKILSILCLGFVIISWRLNSRPLAIVTALVFLIGLLSPYILRLITTGWMWIGEKIGAVMSRVILSLVFIVVLSPIAIVYRLFAKRDKRGKRSSYFVNRKHTYTAADMEKTF